MSSDSVALREGQATGRLLRSVGVNLDLAPVADVEHVQGSFLGTRSFGSSPSIVASRACAFAQGLTSQGVAYTLKHFPGLGRARSSTDTGPVSIDAPANALRDDYQAYLGCASSPLAIVMISSAIYPNLSGPRPAVMSPAIYQQELRIASRGPVVPTISDDLQTPALAGQGSPARKAIAAGLDLAMYAQTEQASASAYSILLADVHSGRLSAQRIRQATQAIQTLKHQVGGAG
jgi:beta-N-acetylhexosaminidase